MRQSNLIWGLYSNSLFTVNGVSVALEILAVEAEDGRLKTGAVAAGPEKLRYAAEALRRGEAGGALDALRVVTALSKFDPTLQALKRALRRLCLV